MPRRAAASHRSSPAPRPGLTTDVPRPEACHMSSNRDDPAVSANIAAFAPEVRAVLERIHRTARAAARATTRTGARRRRGPS